jgi:S1-C subfamily serine protease
MRFAFVLVLLSITFGSPVHAQLPFSATENTAADVVDMVRPAVVQVGVEITDSSMIPAIPYSLAPCFRDLPVCVVGTGFFVNDSGDIVTACHVANGFHELGDGSKPGVQQIIQLLEATAIHAIAVVGVNLPDVETPRLRITSAMRFFPATLVAMDAAHDIAVFRATVNPFTNMDTLLIVPNIAGIPHARAKFVKLDSRRPRDTEEIFACGFPFGEPGLVTTLGAIASAGKTEKLVTDASEAFPWPVDVYWADLRINPGNSGGPVFRMKDHTVVGVAVEAWGSLGIIVPAKYVVEFLNAQAIKFSSAETN